MLTPCLFFRLMLYLTKLHIIVSSIIHISQANALTYKILYTLDPVTFLEMNLSRFV